MPDGLCVAMLNAGGNEFYIIGYEPRLRATYESPRSRRNSGASGHRHSHRLVII